MKLYLNVFTVDGNWGAWGSYDTCTKTCGGGEHKRIRACDNPPPQYGGKQWPGQHREDRTCNTCPCASKHATLST